MKQFLFFLLIATFIYPVFSQNELTEKVEIDWWILPLFAVDKDGNSILDLKKSDITLKVNNQDITAFTLYKREFAIEKISEKIGEKKPVLPTKKNKIVFLLFDISFTNSTNHRQAKEIAKNLVLKAEKTTLFSVIAIDPLSGPQYIGGPLSDKKQVIKLIEQKIKWDPQTKSISTVLLLGGASQVPAPTKAEGRLDERDIEFKTEQASFVIKEANRKYFQAFQSLYYTLNSIKDHKFIYLFSEGISLFARTILTGMGEDEYLYFMKQTANYLGQSGGVLFIINPAGSKMSYRNDASGEGSLRYLAKESGGKYLEGEKNTINRQIEKMHRSYYEIGFPDQETFHGKIHHITITSKRKGVKIQTLRNMEKTKQYSEMKDIEKEVLVLNMMNASPLFKSPLNIRALDIAKKSEKKGKIQYKIKLPQDFKGKNIDIFKIWLNKKKSEATVKKETIVSWDHSLKINLKKREDTITRLVLINGELNTALVQGIFDAETKQESILKSSASDFFNKMKKMTAKEKLELDQIKTRTAVYCKKVGEAAFHYICKETINEILFAFYVHKAERDPKLDSSSDTYLTGVGIPSSRKVVIRKLTNKYVNDYQIINNKGRIKEQRKLLKGKKKKREGMEGQVKLDYFITKNISLSPLSLLGADSQERFFYRFVKYEKLKGVKTAVIECFPKDMDNIKSVYGKIWIDLSDFSVMRMNINPSSIGGYGNLLKLARYFKSKLILKCEIDFFKKRRGIRFPTQVLIREKYSGGRDLIRVVGRAVWERSRTIYAFKDYQFFDVSTTVENEKIKE